LGSLLKPSITEPKDREAGVMETGTTPVPVRLEFSVFPTPAETERVPVCAPAVVGSSETAIVQDELPATEAPHVPPLTWAKGPVRETVSGIGVVDEFFTVNENGALGTPSPTLPNPCEAGDRAMGVVPVPLNEIVCVAVAALSATTTLPACAATAVGMKEIVILQFFPAATDVPHVLVCVNGPVALTLVTASAVLLLLVRVTLFVALLDPTGVLPNVTDVAESVAVCACAPLANAPNTNRQTNRRMLKRKLLVIQSLTSIRGIFFKQTKWLQLASVGPTEYRVLSAKYPSFLACTL
jgi:hypothetical protein